MYFLKSDFKWKVSGLWKREGEKLGETFVACFTMMQHYTDIIRVYLTQNDQKAFLVEIPKPYWQLLKPNFECCAYGKYTVEGLLRNTEMLVCLI